MKKLYLVLLIVWISAVLFSAPAVGHQSLNQSFQISSRSANSMDISFSVPEYEIHEEVVGGKVFHHIDLPGAGYTVEQGMPELPIIGTSLIIPARGSVSIEAISVSEQSLGNYNPYPVQQSMDMEIPKAFVVNEDFYSGGGFYPSNALEYGEPAVLRDFRMISLQISPFYYNSVTGELGVRQNMELRVNFSDAPGLNELAAEPTSISPHFEKLYSSTFLNFDQYRDLIEVGTPPKYLLIYGNNTDPVFVSALDDYVLWKRQKGADVRVVSTSVAGTSTTAIKTYIQNLYNDPTTRPDYIILLGDTGGSYAIPAYTVGGGGGDYPYTHLAGTDGVGDVYMGRISVENISQVLTVFNKIYMFERDINLDTADWINKMLLAADWTPSGVSTVYMSKYMKETSHVVNPNYQYTEVYGASDLGTAVHAAINQGIGMYNFRGYIDLAGWNPTGTYYNGFKTPHTIMITCATNNYANGLGKAEGFFRLGSATAPAGAVTATGMSTSSTHTTFNNMLNAGMIHGLYQANMRTMGESMLAGKVYIHQIFGTAAPTAATNFAHWLNLMGDPTMEVWANIPKQFQVSFEPSIPLGLSLLDVTVEDSLGVVEGASVTLTQNSEVVSRGYTDSEGHVILILPASLQAGTGVITVSMHDYKPSQLDIVILDEGTLVPGTVMLDDDTFGESNGNNNSIANAGEVIEVNFGLQNTDSEAINGISGYITTNSPYVSFADSTVTYGSIAAGNMGFSTNPIVMTVAHNAPHNVMLRLHLMLTDTAGGSYDISEFILVESPKFSFNTYGVLDGGNQHLDPGETSPMTIGINSIGPVGIEGLYGRLYTLNDLVTINDNVGFFGDIAAGGTATTATDNFEVYAREQVLPGMVIPMQVKLYNDAGFEQYVDFSITIGEVSVQDPLGPDNYGYVIYDDGDWSYAECPVFEWVGIAPTEGGLGTLVALSDGYTSSDEGDQVGATAIVTVDLPFPFQFYGVVYNQASISSNGFIALGASQNAEFRNGRLPGALGPSPIIAPFWDDLATHTAGGVYTWYDRNNNAFVVEWYNMKNGKDGSTPETFQAILYDQAVYPTSFGDGPIKFQYQVFNNINTQSGNEHGMHCSIGIEDHTGTRGLEYTFNNIYPTAASPLGNQRALYITNVPVYNVEAQVILNQTFLQDTNGNNIAEPGETIELGIQLNNIGNAPTGELQATLSSDDEFITITEPEALYYPLAAEQTGVNREPFVVQIAEDAPDGHVVEFHLDIVSGELAWSRQFSIRIDASMLNLHSFIINDMDGEYNGIIDEGETIKLILNLSNPTAVEAREVLGVLSTDAEGVNISNPEITVGHIASNHVMQYVYEVEFASTTGSGSYLPFMFTTSSSNALDYSTMLYVPYNLSAEFTDFEFGGAGFEVESGWSWGNPGHVTAFSGDNVWATNMVSSYPDYIDYKLITPTYLLTQQSQLSFKHYYGAESGYDGGNVSISTNGGNTWNLLTPQGGYTHTNLSGLTGEAGYSGNSNGWQTATFDLTAFSGQAVNFRFRFGSDGSNGGAGWFIDDFNLTGLDKRSGKLTGIVIPTSEYSPELATVTSSNRFTAFPDAEGNFDLYLNRGSYSAEARMAGHQSSTFGPFVVSAENPVVSTEFTLIYLPKPFSIAVTVDNDTGEMNLSWTEPYDPVLPVLAYKVYKRFNTGGFVVVQETTDLSYTETLSLEGSYQYYVTARFINVEGSPSDILSFTFPYVADGDEEIIPGLVTRLGGNFPNPFNPTTTIVFDLASSGDATLGIFNLRGQLVKTLVSGPKSAGRHQVVWDGRDESNREVSSGVYFYRLETKDYRKTLRMMMIK